MTFNLSNFISVATKAVLTVVIISSMSAPVSTQAAGTATYQPQTTLEYISYLQGVVDALIAQINAQKNYDAESSVRVDASSVVEVKTNVELKASFDSDSSSYVYAWFQYGQNSVLDKATTKVKVRPIKGVAEHTRVLSNLEPGTYSYRAVFETSNGKKYYGTFKTFSTIANYDSGIISVGGGISVGGTSINTDKTTYKLYENMTVSWTLPSSKADNDNWIGLFKVGSNNTQYDTYRNMADASSGTVNFIPMNTGTYEFRMFLETNGDKKIATSRRITVSK